MSVLPAPVALPCTPRPPRRTRRWTVVSAVLLASMLGCNSLGVFTRDSSPARKENDLPASEPPQPAPGKYTLRIAPCLFYSDSELKREDPVFKDLSNLVDQVYGELKLTPGTAMVQVYLFEDEVRYKRYMKAKEPGLPDRRAFFIANHRPFGGQDELVVYTFRGPKFQQDLRHELTHALLHSVIKQVPQWLDEGLAEYFELPTGSRGLNGVHVAYLQRDFARGMKPDLARLEGLREVNDMAKEDYRESWAWVYLMLRGKPEAKTVLLDYLRVLRDGGEPPPLGPKLAVVFKNPEETLLRHVNALEGEWAPPPTAQKTEGVSPTNNPKMGGLFGDRRP